MASALAQCRSMRSARVLMPRRVRKRIANGPGYAADCVLQIRDRSASSGSRTIAAHDGV